MPKGLVRKAEPERETKEGQPGTVMAVKNNNSAFKSLKTQGDTEKKAKKKLIATRCN